MNPNDASLSPVPDSGNAGAEKTLDVATVKVERKTFVFTLKENPRGRFLRITEEAGGRKNAIIVPACGIGTFIKTFQDLYSKHSP